MLSWRIGIVMRIWFGMLARLQGLDWGSAAGAAWPAPTPVFQATGPVRIALPYMGDHCTLRISTRWAPWPKVTTTLERRCASRASGRLSGKLRRVAVETREWMGRGW